MSRVQEYLRNKKIIELGLPKLYVVKSTREGVDKPIERQVVEIVEGVAFRGEERHRIDRYKLEGEFPYGVDMGVGEISAADDGYGTGVDTWSWTYYSTLSKEDADMYYIKELERVKNLYQSTWKD